MQPASKELMESAVEIARGAGKLTLQWFRSSTLEVVVKGDGTPVTAADKAGERYIREQVELIAPGSAFVGEEEGQSAGTSGLTWYIDPIDGTKGFSRGVPLYSTLLAVDDEYGPAVGVIYIPATDEVVWAGRGLGAWTDEGPARVSTTSQIKGVALTTSGVSRWGKDLYGRIDDAGIDIRGWGDGYGFLMVATGRVDAMLDLGVGGPWDFAPLPVIMAEAGGRYSDLNGVTTLDTLNGLASNGVVHDELLRLIKG